jgi:hypothetical protein
MKPASRLYRRRYPSFLLEAVDWAMEIKYEKRPQNAGELLAALNQGDSDTYSEMPTSEKLQAS